MTPNGSIRSHLVSCGYVRNETFDMFVRKRLRAGTCVSPSDVNLVVGPSDADHVVGSISVCVSVFADVALCDCVSYPFFRVDGTVNMLMQYSTTAITAVVACVAFAVHVLALLGENLPYGCSDEPLYDVNLCYESKADHAMYWISLLMYLVNLGLSYDFEEGASLKLTRYIMCSHLVC